MTPPGLPTVWYIAGHELTEAVMVGLAASAIYDHQTPVQFLEELRAGEMKVFVVDPDTTPIYFAVSVRESPTHRALQVDGVWVPQPGLGYKWRNWLAALNGLATEWGCAKIETAVKDLDQMRLLMALGCKVDSVALSLEVKDYAHGQ